MRLGALICRAVVKDHDTDVGFLCPLPLPVFLEEDKTGPRRSCGIGRRRERSGRHRQYGKTVAGGVQPVRPQPRLSGCCRFAQGTLAEAHGNGRAGKRASRPACYSFVQIICFGRFRIEPDDRLCSAGVVVGEDAAGARW